MERGHNLPARLPILLAHRDAGLLQWAGGASWPVAAYLAANSLISLVAVYLASERYRAEIFDGRPGDNSLVGERG